MLSGKKVKDDRSDKYLLQDENGFSYVLPITFTGKVKKQSDDSITVRGYRQKYPYIRINFYRYIISGKKKYKQPDALNGKKIKVTIEVLED